MNRTSCVLCLVVSGCASAPAPRPPADQVQRYLDARLRGDVESMAAEVRAQDRELERQAEYASWSSPDHRVLRVAEPRQLAVFEAELMAPDAEEFAACMLEGVADGAEVNALLEPCKKAAPDKEQTARVVLELTAEGWRVVSLSAALTRYAERTEQGAESSELRGLDAEIALLTGESMERPPAEALTQPMLEKLEGLLDAFGTPVPPLPELGADHEAPALGIPVTQVSAHEFIVLVDPLSDTFTRTVLESCRVVPHHRDGQFAGFELSGIRAGSLPSALGLSNGDVIEAVNGIPITSPDQALAAYGEQPVRERLELTVRPAEGELYRLTIRFQSEL